MNRNDDESLLIARIWAILVENVYVRLFREILLQLLSDRSAGMRRVVLDCSV